MKYEESKADKKEDMKGAKKMKGFKKGGPTSLDMKKFGRNLARAKNQTGGK